jgi:hypothetical protein
MVSLTMGSKYLDSPREWKNYGADCNVPGRYCVQLRATLPDVLVECAVVEHNIDQDTAFRSTILPSSPGIQIFGL